MQDVGDRNVGEAQGGTPADVVVDGDIEIVFVRDAAKDVTQFDVAYADGFDEG